MEATACNAITFQDFLQYIVKENLQKHIVMILDNARIHHAKLLKPFLRKNSQRLSLIFTALFTEFKFTRTYLEMLKRKRHF